MVMNEVFEISYTTTAENLQLTYNSMGAMIELRLQEIANKTAVPRDSLSGTLVLNDDDTNPTVPLTGTLEAAPGTAVEARSSGAPLAGRPANRSAVVAAIAWPPNHHLYRMHMRKLQSVTADPSTPLDLHSCNKNLTHIYVAVLYETDSTAARDAYVVAAASIVLDPVVTNALGTDLEAKRCAGPNVTAMGREVVDYPSPPIPPPPPPPTFIPRWAWIVAAASAGVAGLCLCCCCFWWLCAAGWYDYDDEEEKTAFVVGGDEQKLLNRARFRTFVL